MVVSAFYAFENECVIFMCILKRTDYHLRYPKKCMQSWHWHPKDFSFLSLSIIFLLFHITMEIYSHFLKLTSHWLSYHDYCIKMICIRYSSLVLRMNFSDVHAAFKENTEFLEKTTWPVLSSRENMNFNPSSILLWGLQLPNCSEL